MLKGADKLEKTPDGHQAVYLGQHQYARYGGRRGEDIRQPLVRPELRGGRKQRGEAQSQKHRPESLSKHPSGGGAPYLDLLFGHRGCQDVEFSLVARSASGYMVRSLQLYIHERRTFAAHLRCRRTRR